MSMLIGQQRNFVILKMVMKKDVNVLIVYNGRDEKVNSLAILLLGTIKSNSKAHNSASDQNWISLLMIVILPHSQYVNSSFKNIFFESLLLWE